MTLFLIVYFFLEPEKKRTQIKQSHWSKPTISKFLKDESCATSEVAQLLISRNLRLRKLKDSFFSQNRRMSYESIFFIIVLHNSSTTYNIKKITTCNTTLQLDIIQRKKRKITSIIIMLMSLCTRSLLECLLKL